uniref:Uncharacterized protein n=1 Tax=Arundo donax TaxID=35708 RepID=A0A0A8ZRK1_ARUDO
MCRRWTASTAGRRCISRRPKATSSASGCC